MKSVHKPDNPHWVKKVYSNESWVKETFQYIDNDVSLTIPANFNTDSCTISFGPPLFPIIPVFWGWPFISFKDRGYLFFSFIIHNSGDVFTIDTKGIKLIKSDGIIVTSNYSQYCKADADINKYVCSAYSHQSGSDSQLVINRYDKILFSVHFSKIDSLNDLRIEFDKSFAKGKLLNIPPIVLRSDYKIIYYPFVLTGHEPGFNE